MNRTAAEAEIRRIFVTYTGHGVPASLPAGKLYELYVVSLLVAELAARGFSLNFVGTTLKFKSSPGMLDVADPHFEITAPRKAAPSYWLFVDIEFDTLGHSIKASTDNSRRHEIDIVVVEKTAGYPAHDEIALGVECKAVANFKKGILKEVLGIRRELGRLITTNIRSVLTKAGGTPAVTLPMDPASEYWLAFIDPKGKRYAQGPLNYGIELKHFQP